MILKKLIFSALLVPAAAVAAEAPPRTPTGQWIVDFADSQCIAVRDYGTAEEPLRLVFKAPPVGEVMQLAVLRKDDRTLADQVEATIGIDDRRPFKTNMLRFTPKGSESRIYLLNLSSADFAPMRLARSLAIRSRGLDESFALSQMEPLLKVIDECVADLRTVFNVGDPQGAEAPKLQRRAKANLHKYFSDNDYPGVAMGNEQSGVVRFVLLIDEQGRVADCTVTQTSGVAALDAQTCAVLKERARFEPALDLEGKPAKDAVMQRVSWRL